MKILYHLSSRQKKDLLIRGTPLDIAIPVPPIEVTDPVDWARTMLPAELRPHVVSAREEQIQVMPATNGAGDGLTRIIGVIRSDDMPHAWSITVVVIVIRLALASTRHAPARLAWPADVMVDGKSLAGDQ